MTSINQTLAATAKHAHVTRAALSRLVADGYGEMELASYSGTAFAGNKNSNRYRTIEALKRDGYVIAGEVCGPKRRYATQGNVMYLAVFKI